MKGCCWADRCHPDTDTHRQSNFRPPGRRCLHDPRQRSSERFYSCKDSSSSHASGMDTRSFFKALSVVHCAARHPQRMKRPFASAGSLRPKAADGRLGPGGPSHGSPEPPPGRGSSMFESSPPAPLREGDSSLFDESARGPACARSDGRSGSTQDLERRAGRQASPTLMRVSLDGGCSGEPHEQALAQGGRRPPLVAATHVGMTQMTSPRDRSDDPWASALRRLVIAAHRMGERSHTHGPPWRVGCASPFWHSRTDSKRVPPNNGGQPTNDLFTGSPGW